MILVKTPTMVGYASRFQIEEYLDGFAVSVLFLDGFKFGVYKCKDIREAQGFIKTVDKNNVFEFTEVFHV